ncbi:PREDICTED: F-box/kelch-repeat protein At4g39560-like [Camelina sativa]|uniref:F-box/kelch-repeat protein At4g39560-like n=1 Tax=Camelina sativa TaxID=90675 RepID=A0ABM0UUD8_CAMSA|nr:PREDICTED: F-box/kelch-repeat protein At4g39560-like [Camelina sativa]
MSLSTRSSVAMNDEEPPIEKEKLTAQAYPISSLPDDLLLSIFARVSRVYYPILSLVSKSFRSLIASPELYETRSLLGRTESCLYVCLKLPPDFNTTWFTLCRRPDQTHKKQKKSMGRNLLVPIPSLESPPVHSSNLVAVGSKIYNIGGDAKSSSTVSILDCKSHTWCEAPSMLVERSYPVSNVIDGKIYVAGGCEEECKSSNWIEVFDSKKQTWELVSCPLVDGWVTHTRKSAVIDGNIFMFARLCAGLAYMPKEDRWEALSVLTSFELEWESLCYCVVDNVLYCYDKGIIWYNPKVGSWFKLKSLIGLPKFDDHVGVKVKMAEYGGKMVIFWDKYLPSWGYKKNKVIWCAVKRFVGVERFWGRLSGLMLCLQSPRNINSCLLFLLLFD